MPPLRKIPCRLVRCDPTADENACGLLQMAHSVPAAILYSSYWYRSGTNRTMREHLKGIVKSALGMLKRKRGTALDIGCNDGTLLKGFGRHGVRTLGVDPAENLAALEHGSGVDRYVGFFGEASSTEIVERWGRARSQFDEASTRPESTPPLAAVP